MISYAFRICSRPLMTLIVDLLENEVRVAHPDSPSGHRPEAPRAPGFGRYFHGDKTSDLEKEVRVAHPDSPSGIRGLLICQSTTFVHFPFVPSIGFGTSASKCRTGAKRPSEKIGESLLLRLGRFWPRAQMFIDCNFRREHRQFHGGWDLGTQVRFVCGVRRARPPGT